jgi:dTMP kinase
MVFEMTNPPHFISLEGGEAVGKSTQIALLAERLKDLGQQVLVTREPGGTPLGEAIRHLLKHEPSVRDMNSHAELLLFLASRAELVRRVINPALQEGKWILSDRFLDSTTVYQGAGRRLPIEIVERINAFAVGSTAPALTLVLDLSPEEAKRRLTKRTSPISGFDRMEKQPADFFERVREGYREVAKAHPNRVKIISASGTIEATAKLVWGEVAAVFGL